MIEVYAKLFAYNLLTFNISYILQYQEIKDSMCIGAE